MTRYVVTDVAGSRPDVAGILRRPGDVIDLTPAQAEWELRRGIVRAVSPAGAAVAAPGRTD